MHSRPVHRSSHRNQQLKQLRAAEHYPWMIDIAVLERDDLLYVTGMGIHAFNAISAHLPGRIPGRYTVACRTQEFVKEFISGDLAEKQRWQRVTRSQKRRMHHPSCPPNCRKAHR